MKSKTFQKAEKYSLSRSQLESFVSCKRCFYFEVRHHLKAPSAGGYPINSFMDKHLKAHMDELASKDEPLPFEFPGLGKLKPFVHSEMKNWQNSFRGVRFHEPKSDFELYGAIDTILEDDSGNLYTTDFKATSSKEINLNDPFKQANCRQVAIYNWLLRKNGIPMSDKGILIYFNAREFQKVDYALKFQSERFCFPTDESWIEDALLKIRATLESDTPPDLLEDCDLCQFSKKIRAL